MCKAMKFRIGLPNRGRLNELGKKVIFDAFGIDDSKIPNRKSVVQVNDLIELVFYRSTEIPKLLEEGKIHLGLTGNDYYIESNKSIVEIYDLHILNGALGIIANKNNKITSIEEMVNKENVLCLSQYPNMATDLFKDFTNVTVEKIDGSAESYLYLNECDIVVDIISSGSSYIENELKVLYSIMPTSGHLYTNKYIYENEFELLKNIAKQITGLELKTEVFSTLKNYQKAKNKLIYYMQDGLEKHEV